MSTTATRPRKGTASTSTIATDLTALLDKSIKQVNKRAKTPTTSTTPTAKTKSTTKTAPVHVPVTKRTRAAVGQGYVTHEYERTADERPCPTCSDPHVHAKGLCSTDYNFARALMAQGLSDAALRNAIRAKRRAHSLPSTTADEPLTPAKPARSRRVRAQVAA